MQLPVMPPVSPMLAKAVKGMPTPDSTPAGLLYEPKWDGLSLYKVKGPALLSFLRVWH